MSFKSEAQRKFMYANHPRIARKWQKETSDRKLSVRKDQVTRRIPRSK